MIYGLLNENLIRQSKTRKTNTIMKAILRITLLVVSVGLLVANSSMAQRVIKGTVYNNGEPMAGVTVESNRGSSMMTSFDGKYEVQADPKSKWIKFTFLDDTRRVDPD